MEDLLAILPEILLVALDMFNHDAQATFGELWLLLTAALAPFYWVANTKSFVEASLVVLCSHQLSNLALLGLLVQKNLGTVVANASEDLADVLNETAMIHRALKDDVSEMPRALALVYMLNNE